MAVKVAILTDTAKSNIHFKKQIQLQGAARQIVLFKPDHSVSLSTDHPLANDNPRMFSVPPGTEKLNKFHQADKKPWYSWLNIIALNQLSYLQFCPIIINRMVF